MVENSGKTAKPRGRGFKPGQSGNPGGRPKIPSDFKEQCRAYTPTALARLRREVDEDGPNWFKAAELLLAYAEGRPSQQLEHTGKDGEALAVQIIRTVGP